MFIFFSFVLFSSFRANNNIALHSIEYLIRFYPIHTREFMCCDWQTTRMKNFPVEWDGIEIEEKPQHEIM